MVSHYSPLSTGQEHRAANSISEKMARSLLLLGVVATLLAASNLVEAQRFPFSISDTALEKMTNASDVTRYNAFLGDLAAFQTENVTYHQTIQPCIDSSITQPCTTCFIAACQARHAEACAPDEPVPVYVAPTTTAAPPVTYDRPAAAEGNFMESVDSFFKGIGGGINTGINDAGTAAEELARQAFTAAHNAALEAERVAAEAAREAERLATEAAQAAAREAERLAAEAAAAAEEAWKKITSFRRRRSLDQSGPEPTCEQLNTQDLFSENCPYYKQDSYCSVCSTNPESVCPGYDAYERTNLLLERWRTVNYTINSVTYEFVVSIGGYTNYTSSVDIFGVTYHITLPDTTDIHDNEAVGIEIAQKALAAANAA